MDKHIYKDGFQFGAEQVKSNAKYMNLNHP